MGDHTGGVGRGAGRISAGQAATIAYRNFADATEALTFMNKTYSDQVLLLPAEQRLALRMWSDEPNKEINEYLRGQTSLNPYAATITAIDKAFADSSSILQQDLVVKRAFGDYHDTLARLKVGDVFTDNGYAATTVKPGGLNWSTENIEIRVPRGTRATWIAPVARFPKEGELLLKRGTSFRVIGKYGNLPILEVIGQE